MLLILKKVLQPDEDLVQLLKLRLILFNTLFLLADIEPIFLKEIEEVLQKNLKLKLVKKNTHVNLLNMMYKLQ